MNSIPLFISTNQYINLDLLMNSITLYIPLIFVIWIIYLWIKKEDKHKDIVLYSIYAAILGFAINFVVESLFLNPFETFSDPVTFMFSAALIMVYFKETRKTGMILLILGLAVAFMSIYSIQLPLDVLESAVIAVISTVIIYLIKEKLVSLNQIFKLIYIILK